MNPNPRKAIDLFSRDEIRSLTARSDAWGAWAIVSTWAIIGLTLAALAQWPHPITFIAAVIILGGRQLALAIQMHDAAHYTLFRTRWLNETVADWLAARPMWNDVARYREHHMRHHAHTGSERDPDLSLVAPFPTTRRSLARKFARDLTGISAVRRIIGLFLMDIGVFHYTVAADVKPRPRNGRSHWDYVREGVKNMLPFVLTNLAFAGILAACGILWTYWAWVAAYFTSFSVYVRIRSMAEHACTEMSDDPLRNTRTTLANVLARMTVAPMNVNYHLEHHLLASVPYYRLPAMHRLLRDRSGIRPASGYREVLELASAA